MIIKKFLFSALLIGSLPLINSCKKVEGPGGTSTIKGYVVEQKYNSVGSLIATYPAADVDVYIVYGSDDTFQDDDVKTSYDGSFEFKYLQNGNYQLFTYEDCNTCASGKKEVLIDVAITDKKSTVEVDTIYIKKL